MVWHHSRQENKIYLTFDDGPVPGVTDFVLEQLAQRGMKATFFMVGDNVRKYPELAKHVVLEGHGIGNHTFSHMDGYQNKAGHYLNDILLCQEELIKATGKTPVIFRPPYGRVTKKQLHLISPMYRVVLWDVISGDYDKRQSNEKCLNKAKQHSQKGSIVLFHDQEKTAAVIRAVLPKYLNFIQKSGFETCTL